MGGSGESAPGFRDVTYEQCKSAVKEVGKQMTTTFIVFVAVHLNMKHGHRLIDLLEAMRRTEGTDEDISKLLGRGSKNTLNGYKDYYTTFTGLIAKNVSTISFDDLAKLMKKASSSVRRYLDHHQGLAQAFGISIIDTPREQRAQIQTAPRARESVDFPALYRTAVEDIVRVRKQQRGEFPDPDGIKPKDIYDKLPPNRKPPTSGAISIFLGMKPDFIEKIIDDVRKEGTQ